MEPATQQFKGFAVVELFGHNKIAGFVETQTFGSAVFFRVDVPETDDNPAFSKLFNPSAIYAINPCDEPVAMVVAKGLQERPIQSYSLSIAIRKGIDSQLNCIPEKAEQQDEQESQW